MLSDPQTLIADYHQSLEKKQRNLTKRKVISSLLLQAKLDQYKANLAKGISLNDDQKRAVAKYDDVVNSIALFSEIIETTNEFTKKLEKSLKTAESQFKEKLQNSLANGICDFILVESFLKKVDQPLVKEAIVTESSEEKYQVLSFMKSIFANQTDRVEFASRHETFAKQANLGLFRKHISNFLEESTNNIVFPKNFKPSPISYKSALEFCYTMMNNERCLAALDGRSFISPEETSESSPEAILVPNNNVEIDNKENSMLNSSVPTTTSASFNFLHDSKLKKEEIKSEFLPVNTFLDKAKIDFNERRHTSDQKIDVPNGNIKKETIMATQFKPSNDSNRQNSFTTKIDHFGNRNQYEMENGQSFKPRYPMNSHNINNRVNSNGRIYRRTDLGDHCVNGNHQNQSNFHIRPHMKQTRVETS